MTLALRPYQQEALEAIEAGWPEADAQLVALPTGTGKTHVFAHAAKREADQGRRVLVLAHRDELLQQAQDKIFQATGMATALEKGTAWAHETDRPVVVGSVQTFHAKRLERWPKDAFDLVVVDEAHHSPAHTYRRIFDHFASARLLGVTATPDRADRKSLARVYQRLAYEYTLVQAISDGYLSPIRAKLLPLKVDLNHVRVTSGDFHAADLGDAIAPVLREAVKAIAEHGEGRKTLVFVPLVATSELFVALCREAGLSACHIDGNSADRREILADYAAGRYQVLSNAALLLEGYDCPDIACVVCLRPTKSRPLYQQMIGRGTRIAPGKTDLLLLDFLWHSTRHRLCVPATLFAKDDAEAQAAMARYRPGETDRDLQEAVRDVRREREEQLRQELARQSRQTARVVDPVALAVALHLDALLDYEPVFDWERKPVTDGQRRYLCSLGVDADAVENRGQATVLLDRLIARRAAGLCSVKQAHLLARRGYDPAASTFEEARRLIGRMAAEEGWNRKGVAV